MPCSTPSQTTADIETSVPNAVMPCSDSRHQHHAGRGSASAHRRFPSRRPDTIMLEHRPGAARREHQADGRAPGNASGCCRYGGSNASVANSTMPTTKISTLPTAKLLFFHRPRSSSACSRRFHHHKPVQPQCKECHRGFDLDLETRRTSPRPAHDPAATAKRRCRARAGARPTPSNATRLPGVLAHAGEDAGECRASPPAG